MVMNTDSVDDARVVKTNRRAIESFVVDNSDLETLEALIDRFNVFEAVGVARQELRHSDFLAFLLDPRQNHRLGDSFVKRFLQKILVAAGHLGQPISPVHLDIWDLGRLSIRREWRNIDLLLVDSVNRFAILIENKIGSSEHSDQLGRYLRLVRDEYPPPWQLLAVYLTPEGDAPSEAEFVPADYGTVAEAVDAVAENRRATLDPAVYMLMTHYASMLRRHVVTDSQIADLCRSIYLRHQRALELIFEHRPDLLSDIRSLLVELVETTAGLVLDQSAKQQIRFGALVWDGLPPGEGWTRTGRILLFQFDNRAESLDLGLWIGPGPSKVRLSLISAARARQPPFKFTRKALEAEKWSSIFKRSFLKREDNESKSVDEVEQQIRTQWSQFVNNQLPLIIESIQPDALGLASSGA
nr:PD-(D/E)XK nuclease family protein [Chloroflexia bacterium]